jgi:hypothetical protein
MHLFYHSPALTCSDVSHNQSILAFELTWRSQVPGSNIPQTSEDSHQAFQSASLTLH